MVYANSITRTETDATGEETEREIPYMKGYTVFNAEQCDELPAHYYVLAEPLALTPMQRLEAAEVKAMLAERDKRIEDLTKELDRLRKVRSTGP